MSSLCCDVSVKYTATSATRSQGGFCMRLQTTSLLPSTQGVTAPAAPPGRKLHTRHGCRKQFVVVWRSSVGGSPARSWLDMALKRGKPAPEKCPTLLPHILMSAWLKKGAVMSSGLALYCIGLLTGSKKSADCGWFAEINPSLLFNVKQGSRSAPRMTESSSCPEPGVKAAGLDNTERGMESITQRRKGAWGKGCGQDQT